jgi:nucleotide-binding universal stress UspA family protein
VTTPDRSGTIIVGVDGTDPARTALRWALAEARVRGARVVAVHVWSYAATIPPADALDPVMPVPVLEVTESVEKGAAALVDAEIEAVSEEAEGLAIEKRAVEGSPAEALARVAEGADLLVLGTKGHGGLAGLLIGSVTQSMAHHPPCPLVLVPHRG